MQIIYVSEAKLYFAIDNGKVLSIQKNVTKRINPHEFIVDHLDADFRSIRIEDDSLYLDGLALVEVAEWVLKQKPNSSFRAVGRAYFKLFPGSASVSDVTRAMLRVVAGLEHTAIGEDATCCREIRRAHPAEFAALTYAWSRRHDPGA